MSHNNGASREIVHLVALLATEFGVPPSEARITLSVSQVALTPADDPDASPEYLNGAERFEIPQERLRNMRIDITGGVKEYHLVFREPDA